MSLLYQWLDQSDHQRACVNVVIRIWDSILGVVCEETLNTNYQQEFIPVAIYVRKILGNQFVASNLF